jgi:hypothetical protein
MKKNRFEFLHAFALKADANIELMKSNWTTIPVNSIYEEMKRFKCTGLIIKKCETHEEEKICIDDERVKERRQNCSHCID